MSALLQESLSGTILIAAILLFRRLARRRVPAAAMILLWDIAALRLLIPWSLPGVAGIGTAAASLLQQGAKSVPSQAVPNVPGVFFTVWAAGAAAACMLLVAGYMREARRLNGAVPLETAEVKRISRLVPGSERARMFVSVDTATAVVSGIVRRRIVLPEGYKEWSAETLRCVITHELVHLRRADNLRRILMLAAAALHWFNPLAWAAAAASERDVEAACDARSVRLLGQDSRCAYAHALVDLAEQQRGLRVSASTFSGEASVHDRVQSVLRQVRWTAGSIAAVLIVCIAAVSSFAAGPVSKMESSVSEDVWLSAGSGYIVDANTGQVWDMLGNEAGRLDAQKSLSIEIDGEADAITYSTATVTYVTTGPGDT